LPRIAPLSVLALLLAVPWVSVAQDAPFESGAPRATDHALGLLAADTNGPRSELAWFDQHWQPVHTAFLLDIVRFLPDPASAAGVYELLRRKTAAKLPDSWPDWMRWSWNQAPAPAGDYAGFKSRLYRELDPKFGGYFSASRRALIRLDEVVWGGVRQDGIPPLRKPAMIAAREAGYLDDGNVVFGIDVNGDARAYPKRILAWHEMFVDVVGGVDVAGVYCTLCGTVILYETRIGAKLHHLGTSGFLYRSNKLMYDRDTQSLWSTVEGRPVIGPLAGQGIELKGRSVVTTTWGEWRRRHPDTRVLSLATGHARDYGEGVAYQEYFASDELMFPVPGLDPRLANKDEVLVPRFGRANDKSLAIASSYLRAHPVYHGRHGRQDYVVLTDHSGAHRIYALPKGERFASFDGDATAIDISGRRWRMTESALIGPGKEQRERLPSHSAFWFGWHAAFPDAELVR